MNKGLTYSASLRGSAFRNCFISFPHHWRAFIAPASIPTFSVESNDVSVIVSWSGHTHDQGVGEEEIVCINSKLLKANELSEGEMVIIRQINCPSPCSTTTMASLFTSEWEDLLLNVDNAQEAILMQFRVIKKNQVVPLWLEGGSLVYLKVQGFTPNMTCSLLQYNTEVHILPPSQNQSIVKPLSIKPCLKESEKDQPHYEKTYFWKTLYMLFSLLGYIYRIEKNPFSKELLLSLKSLPISLSPGEYESNLLTKLLTSHPSLVIISKKHVKRTRWEKAEYFIAHIYKLSYESHLPNESSESENGNIFTVVVIWENLKSNCGIKSSVFKELDLVLNQHTCILSYGLRKKLSVSTKSIIVLETFENIPKSGSYHLDIHIENVLKKDIKYLKASFISDLTEFCRICPVIFNNHCSFESCINGKLHNIIVSPRDGNPLILDKITVNQLHLNIDNTLNKLVCQKLSVKNEINYNPSGIIFQKENFKKVFEGIRKDLLDLSYQEVHPQFTLLHGHKGLGKTFFIGELTKKLSSYPYFVNCKIISMKTLKGKKVNSVHKILKMAIKETLQYEPSLLILDDLDFLTPTQTKLEDEKGPLFEYNTNMVFMIKNLLSQLMEVIKEMRHISRNSGLSRGGFISVLATCCSRSDVHTVLSSPKGIHLFPKSFYLSSLNDNKRFEILTLMLQDKYENLLNENVLKYKNNIDRNIFHFKKSETIPLLEKLTLPDILNLTLRIFLEAKSRWLLNFKYDENFSDVETYFSCPFTYNDDDVQNAVTGFIPIAAKAVNVKTFKEKKKKIGGLDKAQQALEEMIIWPSKYRHTFSKTKLRLRSGILLYGPPGCGKTLLAKSYEGLPHISFITIKGPELLSKYIGQSEKAVREAFERAESAKPCVLFFDEFESIAPRRGHDNTGVTDRVVNQLLTQIDGVEGISGVYIIAATSRPDLIDPALLRPGRLDKGIYCPIPERKDREEILDILCEEMRLEDEVDLTYWAKLTNNFTGADLFNLLSTAQIKAAQERIGESLYGNILAERDATSQELQSAQNLDYMISINNKHLEEAFKDTRPSISEEDHKKYGLLHKRFSSEKFNQIFEEITPGKRETLA